MKSRIQLIIIATIYSVVFSEWVFAEEKNNDRSKKIDGVLEYLSQQSKRYIDTKAALASTLENIEKGNRKSFCDAITKTTSKEAFSDIKEKSMMLSSVKNEMNEGQLIKFNEINAIASEINTNDPYDCEIQEGK